MEPCSVLELSNTVLKLSWKLCQFFKAINDAREEVYDYLDTLESIRCVLEEVKEYAEEHWRSSFFRQDELRLILVETLLRDCEIEFALQLSYVEGLDPATASSFFRSSGRKVKWVLSKKTIEGLTKKLEKIQALLLAAVTTSNGRNSVFMREQLASISLDVRQMNAANEAEKVDRERFVSELRQFATLFQKRTSSFIQFAADSNIRCDARLNDLSETLATELSANSRSEAATSGHDAAASGLATWVNDESLDKGLPKTDTAQSSTVAQDAGKTSPEAPSDGETFGQNNSNTSDDLESRKPADVPQDTNRRKLGAGEVFQSAVLEYRKNIPPAEDFLTLISASEAQDAIEPAVKQRKDPSRTRLEQLCSSIFGYSKLIEIVVRDPVITSTTSAMLKLCLSAVTPFDSFQRDLTDSLQEMADVVKLCDRELALYQEPEIFAMVQECYIILLQLLTRFSKNSLKKSLIKFTQAGLREDIERSMSHIRRLSKSVQREVDYQHRAEMREANGRLIEMQVEQRKILMAVEDQRRVLRELQEERNIMNVVQEQQKIMQVVQDIQRRIQDSSFQQGTDLS